MSLSHKNVTQTTSDQTLTAAEKNSKQKAAQPALTQLRHFPIDWSGPPGRVTTAPSTDSDQQENQTRPGMEISFRTLSVSTDMSAVSQETM